MKTEWIKTANLMPTTKDYPIWVIFAEAHSTPTLLTYEFSGGCTHWRPAKADIPEPPQADQAALDHDAYTAWLNDRTSSEDSAWHAALAYERAEVAKMLPDPKWDAKEPNGSAYYRDACENAIESIRARCGGGGK